MDVYFRYWKVLKFGGNASLNFKLPQLQHPLRASAQILVRDLT